MVLQVVSLHCFCWESVDVCVYADDDADADADAEGSYLG